MFPKKNDRITLLGLGLANFGAALLLHQLGFENVFISEISEKGENAFAEELSHTGFEFEFGRHSEQVLESDLIVISPGFPPRAEIFKKIMETGIRVISDIELAYMNFPHKHYIGVTGSNGKSTTASLIHHILNHSGMKSCLCGNIGYPVARAVFEADAEHMVVELSSYQLEYTSRFKPETALLLNLSPNHLEHHGTMEAYLKAKCSIFMNQDDKDLLVHSGIDGLESHLGYHHGRRKQFGFSGSEISFRDSWITIKGSPVIDASGSRLKGRHNIENIMAATAAALEAGVTPDMIAKALQSFSTLEHRLEPCGEKNGDRIFNDSKSTTVVSMLKALESFELGRKVFFLAGGHDKNTSLDPLNIQLVEKVKKALLFGAAGKRFHDHFKEYTSSEIYETVDECLERALAEASPGDVILFSPGCASFDQFKNFEYRGRYFKEITQKMISRPG